MEHQEGRTMGRIKTWVMTTDFPSARNFWVIFDETEIIMLFDMALNVSRGNN